MILEDKDKLFTCHKCLKSFTSMCRSSTLDVVTMLIQCGSFVKMASPKHEPGPKTHNGLSNDCKKQWETESNLESF